MRETINLNPNNVLVTSRLRQMDEEHVSAVTDSINAFGQLTPITVEVLDQPAGDCTHRLIAGRHRLEACRQLGIDVRAEVMHGITSEDATTLEAVENTVRLNLTAAQRVEHQRTILEAMERKLGRALTADEMRAYREDQATKRSVQPSTIVAEEQLAKRIPAQVLSRVAGTKLDNMADLRRLAKVKDKDAMVQRVEHELQWRENTPSAEDKRFAAQWASTILRRALGDQEIQKLISVLALTDTRALIVALRNPDLGLEDARD